MNRNPKCFVAESTKQPHLRQAGKNSIIIIKLANVLGKKIYKQWPKPLPSLILN